MGDSEGQRRAGPHNGDGGRRERASGPPVPLTVPGPSNREEWRRILADSPWLEPARSRFDWIMDAARHAGLLRDGVPRDRKEIGKAIAAALAKEKASEGQNALGVSAEIPAVEQSAEVDTDSISPSPESAFRRELDDVAALLDERTDSLRAGGNGVVAIQGAVAFISLARRAGLI